MLRPSLISLFKVFIVPSSVSGMVSFIPWLSTSFRCCELIFVRRMMSACEQNAEDKDDKDRNDYQNEDAKGECV